MVSHLSFKKGGSGHLLMVLVLVAILVAKWLFSWRENVTHVRLNLICVVRSWERPFSCPSDSCLPIHAHLFMPIFFMPGPIHARPFSCLLGLIHAGTYSCPDWFMPWKSKNKYLWIIHAKTWPRLIHAQIDSCLKEPFHAWIFHAHAYSCRYYTKPQSRI